MTKSCLTMNDDQFHSVYLPLNFAAVPFFPRKDLPACEHWHSLTNYKTLKIVLIHSCFVIEKIPHILTCMDNFGRLTTRGPIHVGLHMTMAYAGINFIHPPPPTPGTNPWSRLERNKITSPGTITVYKNPHLGTK